MILRNRSYFGWGATTADPADPTHGLVVHYNGPASNLTGHDTCVSYWKSTRDFHVNTNGWADIGYSFGACRHGEVFEGRGLNHYQAAQGTTAGNADWYSVTLMLGGDEDATGDQIQAVRDLRAYLMDRGVAGTVRGHRDFVSTDCPGDKLYAMVQDGTFSGGSGGEVTAPSGSPLLSRGSTGARVRRLQQALTKAGHSVGPSGADGDFGPATESAVRALQRRFDLTVDGVYGPQSARALRDALAG
ncbi:N-acetylmuramoyl-L-alanine amidase [Marinactinospora rubrisoli]|uniref:N-acetylmuramoyl-L-alanine amidase n=1 Tax=Marinactinospora rubrisoli TaxID=2715399 RepID=A0ABW2KF62_9ACTN